MPFSFTVAGTAITEMLLTGESLTSLEATLYVGFADLAKRVTRLRQQGFPIQSRRVSFAAVLARCEAAVGGPVSVGKWVRAQPHDLYLTEYYVPAEALAKKGGLRS